MPELIISVIPSCFDSFIPSSTHFLCIDSLLM
jgi:hypothetical protein